MRKERGGSQQAIPLSLSGDNNLLQPETLLPDQFYVFPLTAFVQSGVGRLMHAVLDDAIIAVQRSTISNSVASRRRAQEALEWFAANDESYLFSFLNVCSALGIAPDHIRRRIERLYRAKLQPRFYKIRRVSHI